MNAKLNLILIILIGAGPCHGLKNPISPNSKSNASSVSFDTNDVATKAEPVLRKLVPTTYCGLGNLNIEGIGFKMEWDPYEKFPWMVAILRENTTDKNIYQCGGSLIAPFVVLTGAHCVQARQAKNFKVRAGYFESNDTDAFQDRQVVEMIVHENFNKGSLYNDVALLFLDAPFKAATEINTICLPPPEAYFDMTHCFVKTWTKDHLMPSGQNENIMKTITLPVVPDAECEKDLRKTRLGKLFVLHSSFMCAGKESGEDTCKGDGGSPLICPIGNNTSTFFQVGIVSWGIGCGEENVPGVYASVPRLRSWIDEKLASKGVDPAYYTSD